MRPPYWTTAQTSSAAACAKRPGSKRLLPGRHPPKTRITRLRASTLQRGGARSPHMHDRTTGEQ
ncbi:hypothetical protein ACFFX0_23305 [Citricoccus parietis]|uniref:Uncharacterized protein n=1 Tax=Citricoccus parietis TaxID=592307 RepID=A0ABV5G4V0_9MICC